MAQSWKTYVIISALALSAVGVFIWKKKKRTYVKAGKVSKLFFYPVKSLKCMEVRAGMCTKAGFEVNGVLDRSFMLINSKGVLISQREFPHLVLLSVRISGKNLFISDSARSDLKVEIKDSISPGDKIVDCQIGNDVVKGVDCGDESAAWFQALLEQTGLRLVRFFPDLPSRKYTKKDPFFIKNRNDNPIAFQDACAIDMVSQASIDDLNSKLGEKKVSVHNFRPTVLITECEPFAEDSWKYVKLESGAEIFNFILNPRCLVTTNDPETGQKSNKEPLVTLRKYRIPKDPSLAKLTGAVPCLSISCSVLKPGEIKVGDDIFAHIGAQPQMIQK